MATATAIFDIVYIEMIRQLYGEGNTPYNRPNDIRLNTLAAKEYQRKRYNG